MIMVDDDNEAMKMAQMQDKNKVLSSFLSLKALIVIKAYNTNSHGPSSVIILHWELHWD
jgi:hypothetical protein